MMKKKPTSSSYKKQLLAICHVKHVCLLFLFKISYYLLRCCCFFEGQPVVAYFTVTLIHNYMRVMGIYFYFLRVGLVTGKFFFLFRFAFAVFPFFRFICVAVWGVNFCNIVKLLYAAGFVE